MKRISARNYAPILKSELAVHSRTEKSLGPFRDVVTSDKRDYRNLFTAHGVDCLGQFVRAFLRKKVTASDQSCRLATARRRLCPGRDHLLITLSVVAATRGGLSFVIGSANQGSTMAKRKKRSAKIQKRKGAKARPKAKKLSKAAQGKAAAKRAVARANGRA
jgi:hypothetical protein